MPYPELRAEALRREAAERRVAELEERLAAHEASCREATERRLCERELQLGRVERALGALSDATELFARETDPARIQDGACGIILGRCGHALVWIGEARPDGRIVPVARAGDGSEAYTRDLDVRWDSGPRAAGPGGVAIRERRTVVVGDTRAEASFVPWRAWAVEHGYLSLASVPVPVAGAISRIFVVYARESGAFGPDVVALLEKLAAQLGLALTAAEDRRARAESEQAAELALHETERRLRVLFEAGLIGTVFSNLSEPGGRVYYANDEYLRITGYTREEMRRGELSWKRLTPPQLAHLDVAAAAEARAKGSCTPYEKEYVRRDGSRVAVLVGFAFVDAARDEVVAFILDISARKRAEAELQRVREQLLQAQRLEAVGRLAGGVAHDFNNLLTVIEGFTRLAQDALATGAPADSMLDQVLRASLRAAGLTRQLLAFSRKMPVAPRVFGVYESLRDMEKMVRRLIGEDVLLELSCDAGSHTVCADPGQIDQVVMNLVVNARDAMPRGGRLGIRVEARELGAADLEPGLAPGRYVAVSVEDTGVGMDERVQARLFEPFFTTKEVGKGTGLGLATVYGIVQQARGTVRVESEVAKGSRFTVLLPHAAATPGYDPKASDRRRPREGHETILLVEDDPLVREVVRAMLSSAGYGVVEVGDPTQALGVAASLGRTVDLVLTDVIMPGLDGPSLARSLRARFPGVKVVFMSGYAGEALEGLGGAPCLVKPIGPSELVRAIREALDRPEDGCP